jgi:hypothetical protein
MDELSTIDIILNNKIKVLEALLINSKAINDDDNNDVPGNPEGESAANRVTWAIENLRKESGETRDHLQDLTQSLNEVSKITGLSLRVLTYHFSALPTSIYSTKRTSYCCGHSE